MLMFCAAIAAHAQKDSTETEKEKKFNPNNLVFGGNIGASFGDFTFVRISPQVGYMFNRYFTAGAGVNFIYSSQKYYSGTGQEVYSYNYGYGGLNIFARAFPVRFIMVGVQPELNYNWGKVNYKDSRIPDETLQGEFVPSLLLSGGLMIPSGGRGGMMISVDYDVIQHSRSPYGPNAFVNIGFVF